MSPDAEHPAQLTDGHLVLAQDAARPRVIACHAYYRNTDCQERLAGARPAGSKSVKTVPSVMGTSGVGEAARAGATGLVGGADTGLTDTASASPATPTAAPRDDQPTTRAGLPWRRAQAALASHRQAHTADTTTRILP